MMMIEEEWEPEKEEGDGHFGCPYCGIRLAEGDLASGHCGMCQEEFDPNDAVHQEFDPSYGEEEYE
jgi:hypothetical protein